MKTFRVLAVVSLLSTSLMSQNDVDAIRYSQTFFGGTSRSKAMAGSFGALGADASVMSINPAGIGLYKKGEMNLSFGVRFMGVESMHNGSGNNNYKANVPFEGLSIIGAWDGKLNKDNHHALGLSSNQIANFNSNITIEGRANNKSIMQDILASSKGKNKNALDNTYGGMAYDVYLMDVMAADTINWNYYSLINTKYDVKQSNQIENTGRINEWNFNYAYGYQDKLYLGASLGFPSLNYRHTSVYSEEDDKDSIRLNTYDYPTYVYPSIGVGSFKSMSYTEKYTTNGSGYNLKLGAIYRATDFLRLGASFHSPTIYNLTDTYTYEMTANYDQGGALSTQYPSDNAGRFNYKVITPMKFTGSLAFIYKKMAAINVDYDIINYRHAALQSNPQEFTGVNQTIRNKYNQTANLRIGAELNMKPIFIRGGYAMYGSPFGDTFTGDFVTTFYTGGIGFRLNDFYMDFSFVKSLKNENYYMYNPKYVDKTTLKNSGTTIALTIGSKF